MKPKFSVGRQRRDGWGDTAYPLVKTYLKEVTEEIATFLTPVDAEVAAAAFNREQDERA